MTAASRRRITAFLLRAGFLTAALAIMAGILGMHIMTGAHHMAAAHTIPVAGTGHAAAQVHTSPAGHSGHGTEPVSAGTVPAVTATGLSPCSPAGACPEMSATGAACVLSPGNTALSAPLPGTAPYALPDFGGAAAAGTNYSYSPDSPSPGELCISRT
ncbi:hypothetical protein [Arthrobacter sp. ISL-69]|uniref:hypothetical protein n=1 Tax=Arthrobacter sp. ISL-69 TaxID=2819113 RepID=UPI00288A650E|nr:hypothetical protein [Arthrobacter sp. ISL-69]